LLKRDWTVPVDNFEKTGVPVGVVFISVPFFMRYDSQITKAPGHTARALLVTAKPDCEFWHGSAGMGFDGVG
jgi:hypothetical protein